MIEHDAYVHRLKVTLRGPHPPIWRRIEVGSGITLFDLAAVLESAMGWCEEHLHGFELRDGRQFQPPVPGAPDLGGLFAPPGDEREAVLGDVLAGRKATMTWTYDFGDGWQHEILVEAVELAADDVEYPRCLGGGRACPPEDCGGWWGYEHLLEVLADPGHDEHEEMVEWLGADRFDPEAFDADVVTERMRAREPTWRGLRDA